MSDEETTDLPATAEEAEAGPSPDELNSIYSEASTMYRDLWQMSRSKIPWNLQEAKKGKTMVVRIEHALRKSVEDYDLFRRLWKQDSRILSDALRFKRDESLLRNLADVQDDILRTLTRGDQGLESQISQAPNVFNLLTNLDD